MGVSSSLLTGLASAVECLQEANLDFALVGGMAVSVRAEPRFTRDIDLAVAVVDDSEAQGVARFLSNRGYRIVTLVEQTRRDRLATIRFSSSNLMPDQPGIILDLLFASSGIEAEVVNAAEFIEIAENITLKVATTAHLVALKVLSRDPQDRLQDEIDLQLLLRETTEEDWIDVRRALRLMRDRGFNRGRDLLGDFEKLVTKYKTAQHRPTPE